ncbi:MAG TPA: DNA replication/repair protein RecF [Microthrixaceae bacterium]|nr:DNA replication/repair protein RecF [Microthrixaceae bacterium]
MRISHLWLTDFRSYSHADVELAPGLTAVLGDNGQGKTNLLEAVGFVSRLGSFRGAPTEALIARAAAAAVVRAEVVAEGRTLLFEAELPRQGRQRVQLNRQRIQRRAELLSTYQVTVFAPDDLELVKAGPALRRDYVDDLIVALRPRHDATRTEVEKVLRQRNALLKQLGGRLDPSSEPTLEVWDERLAAAGEQLGMLRTSLVERLAPLVVEAYHELSGRDDGVELRLVAPWREVGLAAALVASRRDDLRRGLTMVGPHRDELELSVSSMPARTHASQGEQRSLALALRLAGHRLTASELGATPTLLLDDVFSELDPSRSAALLASLPPGQTIVSSAVPLPVGTDPELVLEVRDGSVGQPRSPGA